MKAFNIYFGMQEVKIVLSSATNQQENLIICPPLYLLFEELPRQVRFSVRCHHFAHDLNFEIVTIEWGTNEWRKEDWRPH